MSVRYRCNQVIDIARAVQKRRRMRERERWPRERIAEFQHQRLAQIVAYASRHSPFYRALYGATLSPSDVRLAALPVVTKAAMMEHFDEFVTDPMLRRAELEAHLGQLTGDQLYRGEYRVMASSGSSGRKGIYVFNRAEWCAVLAGSLRLSEFMGVRVRMPHRTRLATIGAPDARHMTFRGAASMDIGLVRTEQLAATLPLAQLVERLNAFQPDIINAYPSIAALLAAEQIEGRLQVSPAVICTAGEQRGTDMTERIRAAWRIEPYDCLGLSETGIAAADCVEHAGLHVFEDQCILEAVDNSNVPVPVGQPGAKLLVTSLFRRVQPIIRMEVSDLLTLEDAACRCGRTLARVKLFAGRADDILELPARNGGKIAVHPIHLHNALAQVPALNQFQIEQTRDGLDVRIVPTARPAGREIVKEVETCLSASLKALGVDTPPLRVVITNAIEREPGAAKLKLIKALR